MKVLKCTSERALLMAEEFFNEMYGLGKDLTVPGDVFKIWKERDGSFKIPIESGVSLAFMEFVTASKQYKKYFDVITEACIVKGFENSSYAEGAVDLFNKCNPDYYINDYEIETFDCEEGTIYVPFIEIVVEQMFWDFTKRRCDLREIIKVGKEKE